MTTEHDFELLGHDCPLGEYPAPVTPVGRLGGQMVCVYVNSDHSPHVQNVPEDITYTPHSPIVSETLAKFDYLQDRLFAFSPDSVVSYSADREVRFFQSLLSDPSFSITNPFIRFSFAKRIATPSILLRELSCCAIYLANKSADFLPVWYSKEREALSTVLADYGLTLPTDVHQLLSPEVTITPRTEIFEEMVAELCKAWADSSIYYSSSRDESHDLYFESPSTTGAQLRTFVECKDASEAIGIDLLKRSFEAWKRQHGDDPFCRYWIVSAAGFTPDAVRDASQCGIELLTLDRLASRSNRSTSPFFIEERSAIFGRTSTDAFFAYRTGQPLESLKAAAAYVDVVQSPSVRPSQLLVILDFSGWKGDFPDLTRDALHSAQTQALLRYQTSVLKGRSFIEETRSGHASVWRNYLLTPECLSSQGRENLRRVLKWQVRAQVNVALCYGGGEMAERLVALSAELRRELLPAASTGTQPVTTPIETLRRETQLLIRTASETMVSEDNQIVADRLITSDRDIDDAIAELADLTI